MPRVVEFIKIERRSVVARGWREGRIGSCSVGGIFQVEKNSGDWLHGSMNVLSTTEL